MSAKPAPVNYLIPLFPCFQLLDVAGPLDILNLLSIINPALAGITLTFVASSLDPVPIKPIPPTDTDGKPRYTFTGIDPLPGASAVNTAFNQTFQPDVTFDQYLAGLADGTINSSPSSKFPLVDVLLIPGGVGTRIDRVHRDGSHTSNIADLVTFTTQIHPHIRHSIMTVCTGSAALAQTRLLDHRRATTNMTRFDSVAAANPDVKWLKARRWVRSSSPSSPPDDPATAFHGDIWTSAGVSAGIDLMLNFIAEMYGGVDTARAASRALEYEWREIPEGAVDPMYGLDYDQLWPWNE